MRAASDDYLKGLRTIADEFGLLLFFDEVQCGMGRTGRLFAHEWSGVKPDIVATAKALGGGFPIGACLATAKVAAAFAPGVHGSTFGGNPLAMAVGNAVLDVMLADGFFPQVDRMAKLLRERLAALGRRYPKLLGELRGRGLMIGIKCVVPNTELMTRLRDAGLLTVTAGDNVLRLLPPLIVGEAEIDEALGAIETVCRSWH
jgi:acetylornithine/N-succinyldiaminopimelate aminotransferase